MRYYEIINEDVKKVMQHISDDVTREIYSIRGVPNLEASLTILDYHNSETGRIVNSIEVYPPAMQGKGYAQILYLAALEDGDLRERPEFRSVEATRTIDRLISKGKVVRTTDDQNRSLLRLA